MICSRILEMKLSGLIMDDNWEVCHEVHFG